jgi:hypothetical protein
MEELQKLEDELKMWKNLSDKKIQGMKGFEPTLRKSKYGYEYEYYPGEFLPSPCKSRKASLAIARIKAKECYNHLSSGEWLEENTRYVVGRIRVLKKVGG